MAASFEEYTRFKYAVENIRDIIWELDIAFCFIFVSKTIKDSLGYSPEELIGRPLFDFLCPESRNRIMDSRNQATPTKTKPVSSNKLAFDVRFMSKNGDLIWFEVSVNPVIENGILKGYIGSSRDISGKKKLEAKMNRYIKGLELANKKLDKLATFDMLTGAYNRRKFEHFFISSVEQKVKNGMPFSIIIFDIDRFKQINDLYGHKKGDDILQEICEITNKLISPSDKLFRWGGDEFIILLQNMDLKMACNFAERIKESIESNDFKISNNDVTLSFGVGEYRPMCSMEQFISIVDNALLLAKSNGRNLVEVAVI